MRRYSSNGRQSRITSSSPASSFGLQLGGGDARRVVAVLDELAERLARHVDAAEELEAGGRARPRCRPRAPTMSRVAELRAGAAAARCGQPVAVVEQHDAASPRARHQVGRASAPAATAAATAAKADAPRRTRLPRARRAAPARRPQPGPPSMPARQSVWVKPCRSLAEYPLRRITPHPNPPPLRGRGEERNAPKISLPPCGGGLGWG